MRRRVWCRGLLSGADVFRVPLETGPSHGVFCNTSVSCEPDNQYRLEASTYHLPLDPATYGDW